MLEVTIKKQLGDFTLDVSFQSQSGVLALLGASGCGKSMTLRCIAGIEKPDSGRIVIDGVTVFDSQKKIDLPPQKRQVGLLFQSYALFPNMTVRENILCGLRKKCTKQEQNTLAAEYIRKFHLEGLEDHLPGQLSGGQKQRCALARMLIGAPKLLMLDEPFSALDSHLRWQLERELLAILRDFQGTVLLVSHDRDEVYRMADHIAVYDTGKIDRFDEKWALFREPVTRTAALLTGCKNIAAAEVSGKNITVPEWGLTYETNHPLPSLGYLGIRARKLRPAHAPGVNIFPYQIIEEIPGAFSDILMVTLAEGCTPLRWELTKESREAIRNAPQLLLIPEDAVLYLTK